jgi:amino acid adenylation domain-containing protein
VPWQVVRDGHGPDLAFVDFSAEPDPERAVEAWIDARRGRALELDQHLTDSALLRLGAEDHLWYLNQHHVITDAWSVTLLRRRLAARYAAVVADAALPGDLDTAHAEYAESERTGRATRRTAALRDYWRRQLASPADEAHFYGRRRRGEGGRTERVALRLDPGRVDRLRSLARRPPFRGLSEDLGMANLLCTAVAAYTALSSGARRVALGLPIHNRARRRDRQTMGLFMEILPLFVDVAPEETLETLGRSVSAASLATLGHGAPGVSSPASNDAYDVVLNVLPMRMAGFEGLESQTRWVHSGHGDPHHTLRIQVHDFEASGGLHLDFDFDVEMFPPAYRQLALGHFDRIIDALLSDLSQPLGAVGLVSEADRHRQVVTFNDTGRAVSEPGIDALVRRHVATMPDAPAVCCGGRTLTYRQLDRQADRLARQLIGAGVAPGQLVALHMERTPEAVTAMLAVLRTGAAYVPLDPRHPPARLATIAADIRATGIASGLLMTDRDDLRLGDLETFHVPDALAGTAVSDAPALPAVGPEDLAYVIYTSGSTGRPKGTAIRHRSLLNYVLWAARQYGAQPATRFALHSSLAVDLTVTSVFVPLATGGCIVAYPDQGPGDLPILRVFADDGVDCLKLTPAHLALLGELDGRCGRIRTLIVGGEELRTELVRSVADRFPPQVRVFNEYGPTEATVGCMIHRFDPTADKGAAVPIGRPIDNARVYVLDAALRPLGTGLVGEMCIGGAGVAAGYLGHAGQGPQPFVADPFEPGSTLYRTGDLGRWTPDGQLEFLGRADAQLKIRGARVEPGEIEAALLAHPSVSAAAVTARTEAHADPSPLTDGAERAPRTTDGHEGVGVRLIAWYVADPVPDVDDLREHLASLLPEEMRPSRLIALDALPLTVAGKVDYRALAGMDEPDAGEAAHTQPQTGVEAQLVTIWCELLDVPAVGRDESFFDLGGTSLGVLQLGARIRSAFGVELPLQRLFGGPTIAELGAIIETLIIEQIEAMTDEQADSLAQDLG